MYVAVGLLSGISAIVVTVILFSNDGFSRLWSPDSFDGAFETLAFQVIGGTIGLLGAGAIAAGVWAAYEEEPGARWAVGIGVLALALLGYAFLVS